MPCMRKARLGLTLLLGSGCTGLLWPALAQAQSEEELAKKLNNPVAAMISVPIQVNYDERYGTAEQGHKWTINVQPVIPFQLNAEWNLISRTILPIVSQSDVLPGSSQSGIGDITQSLFFSPAKPTANGLIWGVGPVFLLPTGSDDRLSARKWGLGPTGLVLKQDGPWTYGALVNHVWGVGGDSDRPDISSSFLQPFLSHTTKTAWTFGLNAESTYDWKGKQWAVPINATVTKLLRFGDQPVSIGGGVRYWAEGPEGGPHDWGFRLVLTFLFPK
jgi:Putative MetA-pathway of phenol degradation